MTMPGGLLSMTGSIANLMRSAGVPQPDLDAHEHEKGLLGRLRHGLGIDRVQPELGALLTPDQRERVKPGILGTIGNAVLTGRGPQAVMQDRAGSMIAMSEQAKRQAQRAELLRLNPRPTDPEKLPEWVASMAAMTANASTPDPEWSKELSTTYAQIRERPMQAAGARLIEDIPDGKGGLLQRLVGADGRVIYEAPQSLSRASSPFGSGTEAGMIMRLRNDYRQQPFVKNARTIDQAYQRIQDTEDNAVGDLSLIFAYMKMLDPESVVRETEFANAQNAAGVPDQIRNLFNRVAKGERLNPNQRAQFRAQAKRLAEGARKQRQESNAEFRRLSSKFGIDPSLIFTEDSDMEQPPAPGAPASRRALPNDPSAYRIP